MRCFTANDMANGKWMIADGKWPKKVSHHLTYAICHLPFAMSFALACPFCKDSVTPGMAKGFFWSILLMLAVPVAVVGAIAGVIWRAGRKKVGLPGAHPE
jgi:hypothetical protein